MSTTHIHTKLCGTQQNQDKAWHIYYNVVRGYLWLCVCVRGCVFAQCKKKTKGCTKQIHIHIQAEAVAAARKCATQMYSHDSGRPCEVVVGGGETVGVAESNNVPCFVLFVTFLHLLIS